MVRMSLLDLTSDHEQLLLGVARQAIEYGLEQGQAMAVDEDKYPLPLREPRATFVTLTAAGNLQGCIGSLEAYRPLVSDVASNAYSAAFADPRFQPLTPTQLQALGISISILSPAEALHFESEVDLLEQLRPGIDGVILQQGAKRGTFLPTVWSSLSDRKTFLEHLKLKAGLSAGYWSNDIRAYRYTTHIIGQKD